VGLYVLADIIWGYIILHGTYRGGDRVDTLWIAAAALFAVGAALQPTTRPVERAAPAAEGPPRPRPARSSGRHPRRRHAAAPAGCRTPPSAPASPSSWSFSAALRSSRI